MHKKILIVLLTTIALGGVGYLVYKDSTKPLPGEAVKDLGRGHVPDGTKVDYGSNPPTSGSHYADWTRAGVYENPVSDGHLVHSLEHGYVILSYNCTKKVSYDFFVRSVSAHEEELETNQATPSASEELGEPEWETEECKTLVGKLRQVIEKKGKRKLIVIPRPTLDTKIALTAWGRLEKFNDFDEAKIDSFIDAFRDRGPEQTSE